MSRGLAHIEGRGYVARGHSGAFAVARHRLVQNNQTPGRLTPDSVLQSLLDRVPLNASLPKELDGARLAACGPLPLVLLLAGAVNYQNNLGF